MTRKGLALALVALGLVFLPAVTMPAGAQAADSPHPPASLTATDNPNDSGHGVLLQWEPSPDTERIVAYEVYRLPWRPEAEGPPYALDAPDSVWMQIESVAATILTYVDEEDEPMLGANPNPRYIPRDGMVFYRVRAQAADGTLSAFTPAVPGTAVGNWWHTQRWNALIIALLLCGLMLFFIKRAKEGAKLYIRPIPGLGRIDEAIGRATEMGRPILFVLGTGTAGDIATLAGYTILARVAERTAEYQTKLLVPVNDPVMMIMAQATVKEAYLKAGRPDVYNPDSIFYISAMQFPYVAAVNAMMLREKTATNFYMGVFHAESLLLAEAGSITGAIQISGTDRVPQIPFFVAATDYTLIGEELYAASAYLAQDPKLMGPLKAQDLLKAAILIIAILGVIEVTVLHSGFISSLIAPH